MVCAGPQYKKIGLLLVVLSVSSCAYENDKQGNSPSEEPVLQSEVSFADVQNTIFMPKCQGCHDGRGLFTFDDYETVHHMMANIDHRALVVKDMPPSRPLENHEMALLRSWIEAGGPQ